MAQLRRTTALIFLLPIAFAAAADHLPLVVEAELEAPKYLLGEPITLKVTLANQNAQRVVLPWSPDGPGPFWSIVVEQEGKAVPYIGALSDWPPISASTFFELGPREEVMFPVTLSQDFELKNTGRYTVRVKFDSTATVERALSQGDKLMSKVTAVRSNNVTLTFQIEDTARERVAREILFGGRSTGTPFTLCCFDRKKAEDFLESWPSSRFVPYVWHWLAKTMSPGLKADRLGYLEKVIQVSPLRWPAAEALLEIGRIHEQASDSEKALSTYRRLCKEFSQSPYRRSAERKIEAMERQER